MAVGILISAGIGFIFYGSFPAAVVFLWIVPVYMSLQKKKYLKNKREKLLYQFKDGMNAVAVLLSAGYSIENAFIEARKEVVMLSGDKADISIFFDRIKGQLSNNVNIEDILSEFAVKSQVEDIICFADVFRYVKRSGGNMVEVIKDTVDTISQKADTAREISVLISAKQMEQRIMNIVPLAIILYLRITSPELVGKMYGNLKGIAVMSGCLIVYGAALIIAMKITDIKV